MREEYERSESSRLRASVRGGTGGSGDRNPGEREMGDRHVGAFEADRHRGDRRCGGVPSFGDLGDVVFEFDLEFVDLGEQSLDLVLGGVDPTIGCAGAAATSGRGARIAEQVAGHLRLRLAAAEQAAEQRTSGGQELGTLLALGLLGEHVGTILGSLDLVAQLGGLGLVLVAQLGDLGVGQVVGGALAAGGELLLALTRSAVQLELGVGLDLEREVAGEVIAQILLDRAEERLGVRSGRRAGDR